MDLFCCGAMRKAESHQLASNHPDYLYQKFYPLKKPCPVCNRKKMQWRGIDPQGQLSEFFDIDPGAHAHWLRRAMTEKAIPAPQLVSEYTQRIKSGNIDIQLNYQTKLCQAKRYYKGERV